MNMSLDWDGVVAYFASCYKPAAYTCNLFLWSHCLVPPYLWKIVGPLGHAYAESHGGTEDCFRHPT